MVHIQQGKVYDHPRPNVVAEPPMGNRFYPLKRREEQEKSMDVANSNLIVISFPFNALLDPESTLFIVTAIVANQFRLFPEILHELFLVSTPIGDSVKDERVCT